MRWSLSSLHAGLLPRSCALLMQRDFAGCNAGVSLFVAQDKTTVPVAARAFRLEATLTYSSWSVTRTCSIYAVMGVNLFKERDELLFGTFSRALFTMFQVELHAKQTRESNTIIRLFLARGFLKLIPAHSTLV